MTHSDRREDAHLRYGFLVCLVLWAAIATPLLGQEFEELEGRLEQTRGTERLPLISEYLSRDEAYADPQRAITLGQEALELLAEAPNRGSELAATCGLCRAQVQVEDLESAISFGERCAERAELQEAKAWLAWAYYWCLADAHYLSEQPGMAAVHGVRAVKIYETLEDPRQLARALTSTGIHLEDLGDLTTALEYQLRSRSIFQSIGSLNGEAQALLRIGTAYNSLQDTDRSLEYTRQALETFRAAGSEVGEAAALHNLGVGYARKEQTERALEYFYQALEITRRVSLPRSVALRLLNIGIAHSDLDQLAEALLYLQQARDQFRELGANQHLAISGIEMARVLKNQGGLERGLELLRQSIAEAEELGIEAQILDGYILLAEMEEERGDLHAALAALRHYDEVKSRFLNTSNAQRIAEMEVRFRAESQAREIDKLKEQQTLQALEVQSQRTTRTGLVIGFCLLLIVLALLFNRYRLRAHAARMAEAIENEKAVSAGLLEIDRLKDDFLANTSHELRTPLYGIVGLTESLLDGAAGSLTPEARQNLELILSSGTRLSSLVGDILDSAKLREQGLELTKEPVDLRTLADIVLTLSQPLVAERPIELINAVHEDLPPALADANRVQQVLHNLVGNAIKFTQSGAVTLEARLDGDGIVVRVRDTGIGIAADLQEKIFDSFEQADASIERLYGGTGLGLAISRQLVRLHGGELRVDSVPDEGSTFFFTLPRAPESSLGPREEPSAPSGLRARPITREDQETLPAPETEAGDAPVVLAIDDEPVNLQVLHNHLTPHGYRVHSLTSGAEALERLAAGPVDLVLLDIMMPRMSGYEVCRRIRETYSREELPVIFLSAKNQATDRTTSFEIGGNDYLAKPIARQELLQRVQTQLELLRSHRTRAAEIKVLRGLLPICAQCKKIRDQEGQWGALEVYISQHSEASFSHSLCPHCVGELYPGMAELSLDHEPD